MKKRWTACWAGRRASVTPQTPLLISRQRGRLQMRLQMDPPADPDAAVHALDLLRLLAGQPA